MTFTTRRKTKPPFGGEREKSFFFLGGGSKQETEIENALCKMGALAVRVVVKDDIYCKPVMYTRKK